MVGVSMKEEEFVCLSVYVYDVWKLLNWILM